MVLKNDGNIWWIVNWPIQKTLLYFHKRTGYDGKHIWWDRSISRKLGSFFQMFLNFCAYHYHKWYLTQETLLCQGNMYLITTKHIFLFPHIWNSAWNAWNSSNGAIHFDKLNIPIDLIKVYIQIKTRYVSKNCASWKTISHICWALLLDLWNNIVLIYKLSPWRSMFALWL